MESLLLGFVLIDFYYTAIIFFYNLGPLAIAVRIEPPEGKFTRRGGRIAQQTKDAPDFNLKICR
jgi:hypothetical protein